VASKYPINAVVVFLKNSEQTDVLARHVRRKRYLVCHLLSAESPYYLHVMIPCGEGEQAPWGNLLIPHTSVCFVASGERKTLSGFGGRSS
jgi:hypothetical protein